MRRPDLVIVMGLAVLAGVLAATVAGPVRIGAGIVLELLLTGYALATLVLGAGARARDGRAELLLCTLGGSLVVAALGGLVLDALPGHMDRLAWTLLLVCVTLAAVAATFVRDDSSGLAPAVSRRRLTPRGAVNAVCAVLALCLAVAAIVIARDAADRTPGFSQLSTVPASKAHDPRLIVGLTSHEAHDASYLLVISEDGRPVFRYRLRLEPGAHWEMHTAPVAASTRKVMVRVYRGGQPDLYTSFYPPAGVAS
ncbi:MAG TPA: hypothetical protein VGG08_01325 [Solirubrobacteraceae bacterium]|jgi:uncharacterized membrane protein